jgi:hypothetical protein
MDRIKTSGSCRGCHISYGGQVSVDESDRERGLHVARLILSALTLSLRDLLPLLPDSESTRTVKPSLTHVDQLDRHTRASFVLHSR